MYTNITPQKLGSTYSQSSANFVEYLEKENLELEPEEMEYFFNQHGDKIAAEEVIKEIDHNTAKLKKTEAKFYSITVSPSKHELSHLKNSKDALKKYTRQIMKDYAASFHREINGRPVTVDDIKYYAKIEQQRTFKGTDKQVKENQPYATKISELKNDIRKVERGEIPGDIKKMKSEIEKLEREAPHQQDGKRIVQGMTKPGDQSHIHIIVSRKDASNTFSLSPGSKHKASEVKMHGKIVKRGFDRDKFFQSSEKTFDKMFGYQRNYAETYKARKDFVKNPKLYYESLSKLSGKEKEMAFKIMGKGGFPMLPNIPVSQAQLAMKIFHRLRRGVGVAIKSSSIGV